MSGIRTISLRSVSETVFFPRPYRSRFFFSGLFKFFFQPPNILPTSSSLRATSSQCLLEILAQQIKDDDVIWLLNEIIESFYTKDKIDIGLPLGNLTSQLLVNIYMNEFDHFLKRELKITYCVRYVDDFVMLHENKNYLENVLPEISNFLKTRLKLSLYPHKVFIQTLSSGMDFLGWVHFPHHRIPRTSTKKKDT